MLKKISVIFVFLILNIAAFYYGVIRVDYGILLPGGIAEIDKKVIIDSEFETSGSFNTVFVYSLERPTRMMNLLADSMVGAYSFEMSTSYSKLTNAQMNERGDLLFDTGIEYSLILAYEEANAELSYFLDNISIVYYDSDYNDLDIGIEITGVDGLELGYIEFLEYLSDKDEVVLNTRTGDYPIERTSGFFGMTILPNYTIYDSFPTYELKKSSVSGSSGGLLQTLSIFNSLTEKDYTYGLTIAGTGTISVGGYVGPIGGVTQKVIAAERDGVDIFFAPASNYAEAIEASERLKLDLDIVSVGHFEDAVNYLVSIGDNDE